MTALDLSLLYVCIGLWGLYQRWFMGWIVFDLDQACSGDLWLLAQGRMTPRFVLCLLMGIVA